jgi:iduronate 2-sulfatase
MSTSFRSTAALVAFFVALFGSSVRSAENDAKIKNVLLIISDDLKASVLGCYGDRFCKTPHLDALARRGMVFERAYCQGTSCRPSRQSMMFSRYTGKGEVNLGQHFRENGWYTARVGKIYHMRVPGDIIAGTNGDDVASSWSERFNSPGLEAHTPGDYACLNLNIFTDSLLDRQSTRMPHRMFVSVQYDGDGSDQPDHKSATKAVELLRRHQDQPFFLAVGFVRPHYPMVAPREYFEPYPWQRMQMPPQQTGDLDDIPKLGLAGTISSRNPIGEHPNNQKRMWSSYYASVTFMDEQVGRVLDELDRLGLRDSTAVVFTSDHGYHLGEHGFWQKSNLHEQVLRVPLIMSVPGFASGRTRSIVELVDLYPSLSQLAGLPVPDEVQGVSLVPVLRDHQASVKNGALSFNKGYSLRTDDWHYMRYSDATVELYDMNSDRNEFTNLASDDDYASVVKELDAALNRRLGAAKIKE